MSIAEALRYRFTEPDRRRTIRLIQPGVQLKLAGYLLIITFFFGLVVGLNSWAAYGRLLEVGLESAPTDLRLDIAKQTRNYLFSSAALGACYVFVVLTFSFGYLHSLLGPTVAFERFLHKLRHGDYSARLTLRDEDVVFADLAAQLNELAAHIEQIDRVNARAS